MYRPTVSSAPFGEICWQTNVGLLLLTTTAVAATTNSMIACYLLLIALIEVQRSHSTWRVGYNLRPQVRTKDWVVRSTNEKVGTPMASFYTA